MFCKECGERLPQDLNKFCYKCGTNLSASEVKPEVKIKTIDEFMDQKKVERKGFSKKTKLFPKQMKFPPKEPKYVILNVGIISENSHGMLSIERGSRLPTPVKETFNAGEVLEAALEKRANFDQYFCRYENHVLLYPDQKVVDTIPGTNEEFTVLKYKNALGKPYSRLNLYICKLHDLNTPYGKNFENDRYFYLLFCCIVWKDLFYCIYYDVTLSFFVC